ncbi:MAG: DNA-directed RNA polymerase subunit omega [Verrucomicrobiales bacterium]
MIVDYLPGALLVLPKEEVLINLVSKRVKQLTLGHSPLVETKPRMSFGDIALLEIAEGKLTYSSDEVDSDTIVVNN